MRFRRSMTGQVRTFGSVTAQMGVHAEAEEPVWRRASPAARLICNL